MTTTTIEVTRGATVLNSPRHGGLERMTAGAGLLAGMLRTAIRGLDAWAVRGVEAHNARALERLTAVDHRVVADLRAARDRAEG